MATISSLTELTSAAAADKVAIDDASAAQTKYVSVKNLTGHGYGHIYAASGTGTSLGNIQNTYTEIPFVTNGEGGGATADQANNKVTLPSTGGLFRIEFHISLATVGASDLLTVRAYDGSALIPGTEMKVTSTGANNYESIGACAIYSSSGGEDITVEVKSSGTNAVTFDGGSLVVTPIPASA